MPLSYTRLVLLSIEFQRVIISPVIQPHSCQHAFHTTIAYMYNGLPILTCSPFIRMLEGEGKSIIYGCNLDFWSLHHVPISIL